MDEKVGIFLVIHAYVFFLWNTLLSYTLLYIYYCMKFQPGKQKSLQGENKIINLKIFALKTGDIDIV